MCSKKLKIKAFFHGQKYFYLYDVIFGVARVEFSFERKHNEAVFPGEPEVRAVLAFVDDDASAEVCGHVLQMRPFPPVRPEDAEIRRSSFAVVGKSYGEPRGGGQGDVDLEADQLKSVVDGPKSGGLAISLERDVVDLRGRKNSGFGNCPGRKLSGTHLSSSRKPRKN